MSEETALPSGRWIRNADGGFTHVRERGGGGGRSAAAGGYATVKEEGSSLAQQSTIDFSGFGVEAYDDATNNKTVVRVGGPYPSLVPPSAPTGKPYALLPLVMGSLQNYGTYQRVYYQRIYVPDSLAGTQGYDRARMRCDTGAASGVIRAGVYDDLGNGNGPNNLIADWGTVAATSSGIKALTLTAWKPTAGWYWLAVCIQGDATVKLRGGTAFYPAQHNGSTGAQTIPHALVFIEDGISGALSADGLSVTVSTDCAAPYIQLTKA